MAKEGKVKHSTTPSAMPGNVGPHHKKEMESMKEKCWRGVEKAQKKETV